MARKSIIKASLEAGRPRAPVSAWRGPALVAVMGAALIVLGQCAGRTVDLQSRARGGSVTVDAHGATTWSQFFACYPVPDGFEKIAVMRQYAAGDDAGHPPERVRIPLEVDGEGVSQVEAGWLAALRNEPARCPAGR